MAEVRKTYGQELQELRQSIVKMGALAEELIKGSVKALIERDPALAEKIIAGDEEVDRLEMEIEQKCMRLIALQQPMATDLRLIGSALKIITDIERLADHTTKISRKAIILSGMPQVKPYIDLPKMADLVIELLKSSLDAFVTFDAERARKIIEMDDEIDDYNRRIFTELVELMNRDSASVNAVSHLMVIVQSLERIADHVTNICERIIYIATGRLPEAEEE